MVEADPRAYIDEWGGRALGRPTVRQPSSDAGSNSGGTRPATREARREIFAEAVEILEQEATRPISLDEVARRVATSPRQLQRVFSDFAGLGFRAYLRRLRMTEAAGLLASTALPVKEIARRAGYGDPSQFSKAFKRTYGVSPSQFRATRGGRRDESGRVGPSRTS
jgi:AraC family transcriptional regulator, regulatory protein of adaptative response / methylphosphotriester-DNA alkyltransferase methyltransferase